MPKKNIYENRNPKLRELKQLRKVDVLAKEVQRMAKQVNQRLYRLEKKGLTGDTAYRYAVKETDKSKPRYSTNINKLKEKSLQELYELGIQLNAKIVSKTSTITGLKEIENKRLEMSLKGIFEDNNVTINKEDWKNFLNNGGGELMNNKWLDSFQVAEDWREFTSPGGLTNKEFIEIYKKELEKEKDFDYSNIRRKLINIRKGNK